MKITKQKFFNKIFKLLKKKIFSTKFLNLKNGDEVEMFVKCNFKEKEETMSKASKRFTSQSNSFEIKINKQFDV